MRRAAVALLCVSALCLALAAQAEADKRPIGIADLIEVKAPSKVTISPDGSQIAYVLTTPSLADNALSSDLYVLATDGAGQPRKLASAGSTSSAFASVFRQALTWTPDSRSLVFASHRDGMSEIRTVDVGSGRSAVLVTADMLEDGYEIQGAVGATFKFSPDGRRLAFVARRKPVSPAPEPKPMRAIDADDEWQPAEKRIQPDWMSMMNLFLLDLDSGQVMRMTTDDYDVASFDWSPDGTRLALSLKTDLSRVTSYYTTDLFLLDVDSRQLRPLVRQEGQDDTPLWSPDGRTIAIHTPLLIVMGEDDAITNIDAPKLFAGLRRLERPAQLLIYPGEGHVIYDWSVEQAADVSRRMVGFLRKHLGATGAATGK